MAAHALNRRPQLTWPGGCAQRPPAACVVDSKVPETITSAAFDGGFQNPFIIQVLSDNHGAGCIDNSLARVGITGQSCADRLEGYVDPPASHCNHAVYI